MKVVKIHIHIIEKSNVIGLFRSDKQEYLFYYFIQYLKNYTVLKFTLCKNNLKYNKHQQYRHRTQGQVAIK